MSKISDVIIKLQRLEDVRGNIEVKGVEIGNIYFDEQTEEIIISK